MKKFVSGLVVGLLLFAGASAFADSVGIVGKKVTGSFTVKYKSGEKIADAAIINNSAYVPVRAMSEATGTELTVEGKEIIMNKVDQSDTKESNTEAEIQALETQKMIVEKRILTAQGAINLYDTDIIPRAEEYAKNTVGTPREEQYSKWLADRRAEREKYVNDLSTYKEEIIKIDAQITELQK